MTLLVLGGTGAATQIARALGHRKTDAIFSVAGGARLGRSSDLPERVGGFGGETGFRRFIEEAGITAILDATHPFAAQITQRTARICAELNLPYCLLWRPEWRPEAGDRWTFIDREEDAALHIPDGAVVFLATGRSTLERFANLTGRYLICRQIDPPTGPFPLPNGEFRQGTPPFSVEEERALFQRLKIDWLVVKNAGGAGPETKLIAARELRLPVLLINRPAPPDAPRVDSVEAALAWVERL